MFVCVCMCWLSEVAGAHNYNYITLYKGVIKINSYTVPSVLYYAVT